MQHLLAASFFSLHRYLFLRIPLLAHVVLSAYSRSYAVDDIHVCEPTFEDSSIYMRLEIMASVTDALDVSLRLFNTSKCRSQSGPLHLQLGPIGLVCLFHRPASCLRSNRLRPNLSKRLAHPLLS